MTRVVISQPMYFPWVGFIAQMSLADVMIWLDDVTFSKGSFTNRVQIKSQGGQSWMSVPLAAKGNGVTIRDLATTAPDIQGRHNDMLRNAYSDAAHRAEMLEIFNRCWVSDAPLVDTLIASAEALADTIANKPQEILRSSEMNVSGHGSERVLELVQAVDGCRYITGHGARHYLDHEAFNAADVDVDYMQYDPVPWPQNHGEFTPYVSALDLIAHVSETRRTSHLAPKTVGWQSFLAEH